MKRLALLTVFLPVAALAQPAPQPSPQAAFAAALAQNLSNALAENAALAARVRELEAQLAVKEPKKEEPK